MRAVVLTSFSGPTNLFILPGYEYKVSMHDHQLPPAEINADAGERLCRRKLLNAYQVALKEGYRFFSFGDATLIL